MEDSGTSNGAQNEWQQGRNWKIGKLVSGNERRRGEELMKMDHGGDVVRDLQELRIGLDNS
jgi:hypothetical protein